MKNILQRTNKVDVQGKVYSLNDVNLYAGKDANGAMDNLDLNVESEAYNKTALSVAVPKFKDTLTQANQVIVGKEQKSLVYAMSMPMPMKPINTCGSSR